jgi:MSHA biogenesis protein MshL
MNLNRGNRPRRRQLAQAPAKRKAGNLRDTLKSQDGTTTAPELDIKQASSMVRVRSGETIVMGGLIQNSSAKAVRSIPIIGDIPILGVLFQGKSNARQKKELVIFLTPTIVR